MAPVTKPILLFAASLLLAQAALADQVSERFSLVGSIAVSKKANRSGVAMIRDRNEHKTLVVKVGQKLSSGDVVVAIEKNRVILGGAGHRLIVERELWAGENNSGSTDSSSADTPYFGSAPEPEINYDPNLEVQTPPDFPVDPGTLPVVPPPPPPPYPDPQSFNSFPPPVNPYVPNTSGYSGDAQAPEYDSWQQPAPFNP